MRTSFIVLSLLSCSKAASTTDQLKTSIDSSNLSQAILDGLKRSIQKSIDTALNTKREQIVKANNQEFDKLMVYQKLESVLNDLNNVENIQQLWKGVSEEDKKKDLSKINF